MNRSILTMFCAAGLSISVSPAFGQPSSTPSSAPGGMAQPGQNNGVTPLPVALTTTAIGSEDAPAMIRLNGRYGNASPATLEMIITKLPQHGALMQADGTRIASVPTTVTDPSRSVWFVPPPNDNGSPLTTFNYKVRSNVDGRESAPQAVEIDVLPVPDVPVNGNVTALIYEDTPVIIQLPASDADLDHEGDVLETKIGWTVAPIFGKFYQIGADGAPYGSPVPFNTVVTHPDRLLMYVPSFNFSGNSANFTYTLTDSYGLSVERLVTLNVEPVNDGPRAYPHGLGLSNLVTQTPFQFNPYDYDTPYDDITMTIHDLPVHGEIYRGSIAPEHLITEPETVVNSQETLWYVQTTPGLGMNFDEFTFSFFDGEYHSEIATATVNVFYTNLEPQIDPVPPVTIDEDSGITEWTLVASDADGPQSELRMFVKSLPAHGTLWIENIIYSAWIPVWSENTQLGAVGGPWKIRYVPDLGKNTYGQEPDRFEIWIADAFSNYPSGSSTEVQVTINPINDVPVITGASTATARILVPSGQHIAAIIDDLLISDDSTGSLMSARLTPSQGLDLHMMTLEGLQEYSLNPDGTVDLYGTLEQINAVLAAGIEVDPSGYGVGIVTLAVNDGGCPGDPVDQIGTHQTYIIVTP